MASRKRYEEEIEEILKKMEDRPLPKTHRSIWRYGLGSKIANALASLPERTLPGHWMLISLLLLLISRFLTPSILSRSIGLLAVLIFGAALILTIKGRRISRYQPMWRGRPLNLTGQQSLWQEWWRRLWRR